MAESTYKILAIGDPHFKRGNSQETNLMHKEVINIVKDTQPDLIVVLGDVQHTFERISMSAQNRAIRFLESLCDLAHVFCLVGNHDRINNQEYLTEDSSLLFLRRWPNMTLVDRPVFAGGPFGYIGFVPYVPGGRFEEALQTGLDESGITIQDSIIVFAHQEVKGPMSFSGCKDSWPEDYPLLVSGHIHTSKRYDNVLYTGSPVCNTFAETGEKGVHLLTLSEAGIEEEFKLFSIAPHKTIHLRAEDILEDKLPEFEENTRYRIYIQGNGSDNAVLECSSAIKKWKDHNYKIQYITEPTPLSHTPSDISSGSIQYTPESFFSLLKEELHDDTHALRVLDDYVSLTKPRRRLRITSS